jgi:hypothetical protein
MHKHAITTREFVPVEKGVPFRSRRPQCLVLGPQAPRRIFDVTLDLQLIESLFHRELVYLRPCFGQRRLHRQREYA